MEVDKELLNYLRVIQNDKALSGAFASRNAEFMDIMGSVLKLSARKPIRPLPPVRDLTAVEIAILDNWPQGKKIKSKPVRYGFSLNASADDRPDVTAWPYHFSGSLLDRNAFIAKASELNRSKLANPISPAYVEFIEALPELYAPEDDEPDDFLFGPLQGKIHGEGTVYPHQHVLVLRLEHNKTKVLVRDAVLWVGLGDGPLPLAPFVPFYAGSKPVSDKVKLQSRTARGNAMRGWRSDAGANSLLK